MFSWSKIIFKFQGCCHARDSSSISLAFSSSSVWTGFNTINVCTFTCHHTWHMVMIKAILCAASISLCCTATCYGIHVYFGSCWCMGESTCKDSTLHIQAEQSQIQWRRHLLVCFFHEDDNIMACRICIGRFWHFGGKSIILSGFPLLHVYSCCQASAMPINTQMKDCTASIRSAWVMSPNTLLESRTQILQKGFQSWYRPFPYSCDNISKTMRWCVPSNRRRLAMRFLHVNWMYWILFPYSSSEC